MANTTPSPNMNLPVPSVGIDPGPDWATNLNAALSILDQHNHSSGSGVQITPGGMNINADLSFNSNNATLLRTARFSPQLSTITPSSPDVGCLYVVNNELYYNDVIGGHSVQITNNGVVNAGAGSISGLTSPASASYAGLTFVFQSNVSTPASVDGGSFILRNITANSKGLTLNPPSAMANNYTLTLPSIPASQSFISIDTSGNIAAYASVSQGITGSNIASNIALAGKGVTAGSQNVIVSNTNPATNGLAIIRGVISSTGTIISGEGFTVSSFTGGTCVINYTTSFLGSDTQPMIIVTPYDSVSAGNVALATAVSTIYVGTVYTYGPSGSPANKAFNFMVIGQRA